ncbi:MAG: lysylphosphatidylglycerol synthase domain-containing protein [Candidatus Marinimicrobia bacterium]|nr:lysylphosphatidylglycerol synthase domain-containing protein [Candidatus Neomarinimicrobiota bacterium]
MTQTEIRPLTSKTRTFFINILKLSLFGLIIYLVVCYFKNNITQIYEFPKINGLFLSFTIAVLIGIQIVVVWIFKYLLKIYGESLTYAEVFYSYYYPILTKYLPGKAWHQVGKVILLNQFSVSPSKSITIAFLEQILIVYTGFIISIPFLVKVISGFWVLVILIGSTSIILLMLIYQEKFFVIANRIMRLFRVRKQLSFTKRLHVQNVVILVFFYILYWILLGVFFQICIKSLGSGVHVRWIASIGVFAASWIFGFLAPIAPAGLGVREGAMILLLKNSVDAVSLLNITVGVRLLTTLSEILFFLVAFLIKKRIQRNGVL